MSSFERASISERSRLNPGGNRLQRQTSITCRFERLPIARALHKNVPRCSRRESSELYAEWLKKRPCPLCGTLPDGDRGLRRLPSSKWRPPTRLGGPGVVHHPRQPRLCRVAAKGEVERFAGSSTHRKTAASAVAVGQIVDEEAWPEWTATR